VIDLSRAPRRAFPHQVEGVERIVARVEPERGRIYPGCFALFDEPGAGKSKQVVDAAEELHAQGLIDHVIVVAQAPGRDVWYDPDLGEVAANAWEGSRFRIILYHSRCREWSRGDIRGEDSNRNGDNSGRGYLTWVVTNYEYLRLRDSAGEFRNLGPLMRIASSRTMLVLDESSMVSNHRALQTRACMRLRRECGWVVLLNGTPESGVGVGPEAEEETGSAGCLYAQAALLDPRILGYRTWWQFRANHAVLGGWRNKQIVGWRNVERIQQRMAPYVLRRPKPALPEKLPPTILTVPLSPRSWQLYRQMRDDAVAWLSDQTVSFTRQAGVRVMRLAQLTSGFLGGVAEQVPCRACEATGGTLEEPCGECGGAGTDMQDRPPQEVGDEKLRLVLGWVGQRLRERPTMKALVWVRFRPELARLVAGIRELHSSVDVGELWGDQPRDDRLRTLRLLKPGLAPAGPVVVVGTPATGSMALDFAAGDSVLWASHGTSLRERIQADDRVHRPGQTQRVWYGDVLATGPDGQRTVDHILVRALRRKQRAAEWTCAAWMAALREEEQ
jgi:hypothetical protein